MAKSPSTATKPKPAPPTEAPAPTAVPPGSRAGNLALADLRPSPTNPRKSFPPESLAALADSIKSVGVRQRLLVRPVAAPGHPAARYEPSTDKWVGLAHFEVVAGERRLKAARLAGLDTVPVDVCDLTDDQVLLVQLVENDQREDVRPSEQAAAYRRLADAGRTAERIAADTGKPVGFVRGLLRLGRLPAWALAAVDAGSLPRATAELVARVPGDEGRKRAAACVLLGLIETSLLDDVFNDDDTWEEAAEAIGTGAHVVGDPLSYRDARDLIRNHFTKELKGSPFSLKVLYPKPGREPDSNEYIQSCEACPKRAGNDAEATAEGTRADVCLDPDCYREKVAAYRAGEIEKAAAKGIQEADVEVADMRRQPRGWLFLDSQLQHCPPELDTAGVAARHASRTLKDLLAAPVRVTQYLAFGPGGKPVKLVKTADARKALQEGGVLPKPEKRKAERPSILVSKSVPTYPANGKPAKPSGPSLAEIDGRASAIASSALREYVEGECKSLEDYGEHSPVHSCLGLALRAVCYDLAMRRDEACESILKRLGAGGEMGAGDAIDKTVGAMGPAQLVGLLCEIAAVMELQFGSTARDTARCLLAFAELDWEQLREQARRELTGGETAGAKLDKAEAAQERPPEPDAKTKPKKGKHK